MAFIHDSFMLESDSARILYDEFAKDMPIFDYHCHLNAGEILEDKEFSSITELWLGGDHYKWRLMRANGVDEHYITGDADPYEKFEKWAETISRSYGNPLFVWTQLELKRYFDIDEILNKQTAREIYDRCNELLKKKEYHARALICRSNVRALCTTDDPADSLSAHIGLEEDITFPVQVLPSFRPDKAIHPENAGFTDYLKVLGDAAGVEIKCFDDLKKALYIRLKFFKDHGCVVSDHAFGNANFMPCEKKDADEAFEKALKGETLTEQELSAYFTQLMLYLSSIYCEFDITMQLHLGAVRNTNTTMYRFLGPDTGYDAISDAISVESIIRLMNMMTMQNTLPRTILYSLNGNDQMILNVAAGGFMEAPMVNKVQLGAAWWFQDHRDGMLEQMKALANTGILANFTGMLTDSRSFTSYTRHEYFRRVLCSLFAEWMERGEIPNDFENVGKVIMDICYNNAANFFHLPSEKRF